MSFSRASVVAIQQLSPRMRRITLEVADPTALDVKPGGDSAVGVYFPTTADDGTSRGEPDSGAEGRNYSVRRHVGDRIDLDVVLHARGPGTAWASTAQLGDRVGLDHARSWYQPEPTTDWRLLVTDLAGLPATARIIEELPAGRSATALVEVSEAADLDYLPSHPDVAVIPSIGTGNGHGPSQLARLVREFIWPEGRGYCWFAGEAAESRLVRKHFRGLGWTVEQLDVNGYWRFDSERWDAKYAMVSDAIEAVYVQALTAGKSPKVADEEYDEALERAGL